ncbi:MAG: hypothetical protein KDI61_04760 [Alphaproteobacteria bacterium]|nr:hypothetical protein [Alphaproteobacteria bacterium]MCB1839558.1 hypothetical protein [Alphaproteobacteria bacterium]
MKIKHLLMAAGVTAAALFGAGNFAMAEDEAAAETAVEAAADEAAVEAAEVKELTLADGSKIQISNGQATIVDAEGNETPAPDGEHTLADGTTIKTMGGSVISAPAAGEEEPAAEEAPESEEAPE